MKESMPVTAFGVYRSRPESLMPCFELLHLLSTDPACLCDVQLVKPVQWDNVVRYVSK